MTGPKPFAVKVFGVGPYISTKVWLLVLGRKTVRMLNPKSKPYQVSTCSGVNASIKGNQ